MPKVIKFGGSSLADANQFKKVADIIRADKSRRYVVPSAPGKRFAADVKVTDMLYACYEAVSQGGDPVAEFAAIARRFDGIIKDLELHLDLSDEYKTITENFGKKAGADYAASRGEHLSGLVLANYIGYSFIDPAKAVHFRADGSFDPDLTNASLSLLLKDTRRAVIPGFYGAKPCGEIKTFSRGGSDVTGSIVAKACGARLYENFTDVSGFLVADPRIVKDPEIISVITYRELRELSYMGAGVLHEDAIFPVRKAQIPINIKNTNHPDHPGTMIVPSAENDNARVITGIAGKKNFSVIHIEKDEMNNEIGFLRRILTLFETQGINFEHIPTGIDTLSIVLSSEVFDKHPGIAELIREVARPGHMDVEHGLALIAVVGRKMRERRGTASLIFAALSHANINIRIIDQGSSELNIIIGVNEDDYEAAIRAIYEMSTQFFE